MSRLMTLPLAVVLLAACGGKTGTGAGGAGDSTPQQTSAGGTAVQLSSGGVATGEAGIGIGGAYPATAPVDPIEDACQTVCARYPFTQCELNSGAGSCVASCSSRAHGLSPACEKASLELMLCVGARLDPESTDCVPDHGPCPDGRCDNCSGQGCPVDALFDCSDELLRFTQCGATLVPLPMLGGCSLSEAVDAQTCEATLTCGTMVQRARCTTSLGAEWWDCEHFRDDRPLGGFMIGTPSPDVCVMELMGSLGLQ